jgi:glycine reductase
VLVTALPGVAMKVGANRIVRGKSFSHPCGDPSVDSGAEQRFRIGLIRQALAALQTPVEGPTLFEATGPGA